MEYNNLTSEELFIIRDKGTEAPFTGKYTDYDVSGSYLCRRCNFPLYKSGDKFKSECGWASFDDEIVGSVKRVVDSDGVRTEILCSRCGAHLGHVFAGEGFTSKNIRHCVNSVSLNFVPVDFEISQELERAIYAGGCFWGLEYFLQKQTGVVSAVSGYIGGTTGSPVYEDVCSGSTGHAEAVEVYFNPAVISYKELTKIFFEVHDPTQLNRQGPDVGTQYRSEIFYLRDSQKAIAEDLITGLRGRGYEVVTAVSKATDFFPAEDYHQKYYYHKGILPYCHVRTKRF